LEKVKLGPEYADKMIYTAKQDVYSRTRCMLDLIYSLNNEEYKKLIKEWIASITHMSNISFYYKMQDMMNKIAPQGTFFCEHPNNENEVGFWSGNNG
jgi:hypothetical protein